MHAKTLKKGTFRQILTLKKSTSHTFRTKMIYQQTDRAISVIQM